MSSLSLSIVIGSEISSNIVTSLSKSIDFTDPSGNWLFHCLLYFPVDLADCDNGVVMFRWFVLFDISHTFMFFFSWRSFFSVTVGGDSIGWVILSLLFLYHYFVLLDCLVLHHYLHQKFYSVFRLVIHVYDHFGLGLERSCCLSYHGCIPELIYRDVLLHNCFHI